MQKLMFVSVFVFLLLGGQEPFLNSLAYARHNPNHCCMCGTCNGWCWCSGQANCKCVTYDGKGIQPYSSTINVTLDIRNTSRLQPHSEANSMESVMTLVRGGRLRGSFTMKLTDHVADHMKFKCLSLES